MTQLHLSTYHIQCPKVQKAFSFSCFSARSQFRERSKMTFLANTKVNLGAFDSLSANEEFASKEKVRQYSGSAIQLLYSITVLGDASGGENSHLRFEPPLTSFSHRPHPRSPMSYLHPQAKKSGIFNSRRERRSSSFYLAMQRAREAWCSTSAKRCCFYGKTNRPYEEAMRASNMVH